MLRCQESSLLGNLLAEFNSVFSLVNFEDKGVLRVLRVGIAKFVKTKMRNISINQFRIEIF